MSARPTRAISYPIRVAVLIDAAELNLRIKGDYQIYAHPLLELLREGKALNNVVIKPTYSGISMGGEKFKIYGIKIRPTSTADICINNRRFRGEIDIIRTERLKLLVVNRLDIEDYINGVLYHEVSHWWPMETLKAQAIAARTFAIHKSLESKNKDYDLRSDIYAQVYGGKTSEKFRTNRAVETTAGKILVYKNNIFPTYFHATCGGHTEDASLLWDTDITPLKGKPCKYCQSSPHFNWIKEIPLYTIEKQLSKNGYNIRGINKLKTSGRDASRRVRTVSVIDSLGVEKIPANKFRLAVDPNLIRSTNFTVKIKNEIAIFRGKGWGHGVGMCQWGTYFMARKGFKTEDILSFYYPGTKIADWKDIIKK
jgi:stage II sporulation protein D